MGLIGDDYICIKNSIRINKEHYKTNVRTLLTEIKNSMRTDCGVVVFALVKECF